MVTVFERKNKLFERKIYNMKKAIRCIVTKQGKVLKANNNVARKFSSKLMAKAFIRNLNRVSNAVTLKDFEIVAI
jgi:hypothetical protein